MKGDKLKGQIKACESIVAHDGCYGSAAQCNPGKMSRGMFPCPARCMSEAAKKAMRWSCLRDVESAKAFLARHASPVAPDAQSVGQDRESYSDNQDRESYA